MLWNWPTRLHRLQLLRAPLRAVLPAAKAAEPAPEVEVAAAVPAVEAAAVAVAVAALAPVAVAALRLPPAVTTVAERRPVELVAPEVEEPVVVVVPLEEVPAAAKTAPNTKTNSTNSPSTPSAIRKCCRKSLNASWWTRRSLRRIHLRLAAPIRTDLRRHRPVLKG